MLRASLVVIARSPSIELIIILKWTGKNLGSRHKKEVLPNDALVMGIN